ncbi:NfeD family protein [Thermomonospora cellulosilytica]|uniref:Membrane-bound serine protease (ClpP class) n=1 Tax=Thermomonospora cellulosilytica TaxID=1411118 RepID=A0A7W3N0D0_9ACTN|nr:nodulation protein NfeD [Thermomonospora cellulosilytica]MBA9005208.1 membrane-bound serine protease (ClpP class) [Thermomonospora cellulosilytica]
MCPGRQVLGAGALLCLFAAVIAWSAAVPEHARAQAPTVVVAQVDGAITPVVEGHLADGVRQAEHAGHAAFLVEMDTPGGLLQATRGIVQAFLGAGVPVVVHVAPEGARAASAGAYITMAAHVAAMAPGTHIGAGTPVTQEGQTASDKVVNDSAAFAVTIAERRGRNTEFAADMVRKGTSVSATAAERMQVVDLIAGSRQDLLSQIDGRQVTVSGGRQVTLRTDGARIVEHELGLTGELRQLLADPELAFLFLSIDTLAVIYELANPGMGFGGIAGAILLVLGFIALSVLPVNVGGLLLLALAAGLFAAEVLTPGVGVFAAGGTVSLLLSGLFLFRGDVGVDPAVLWPTALVIGAATMVAGRLAWRARKAPATTGEDALLGREAVVARVHGDSGQVFLEGAWWTVHGRDAPVEKGRSVRVVGRDGLELIVENADAPGRNDGS